MSSSDQNSPPRRAGPKLFISYRRRFDRASARLLRFELTKVFGDEAVFRDVEDIAPGDVFPRRIEEAVKACDTFLVLISPGWLETAGGLHNPDDFVRIEIFAALAREVRVIPLLLNGAQMPSKEQLPTDLGELAVRQARELSDDRWDDDIRRLIEAIRPPRQRPIRNRLSAAVRFLFATWPGRGALAVLLLAVLLTATLPRSPTVEIDRPVTPRIGSIGFDRVADCDAGRSCFWVDTAAAGGVRTGTLYGSGLKGGEVEIGGAPELGITEAKTLADGSSDGALHFSFKLTRAVPPGARLSFGVAKLLRHTDGMVGWSVMGDREYFEVAFAQPTPRPNEAISAGCFRQFLPPGRWVGVEYGDPDYRVVIRHDQPLGETAGILLTEYGRPVGAVKFSFVWSGVNDTGHDSGIFRVEGVVGSDCRPTDKYESLSAGGRKDTLNNYDFLSMRLGERRYDLRVAYRPDKTIAARFADRAD